MWFFSECFSRENSNSSDLYQKYKARAEIILFKLRRTGFLHKLF